MMRSVHRGSASLVIISECARVPATHPISMQEHCNWLVFVWLGFRIRFDSSWHGISEGGWVNKRFNPDRPTLLRACTPFCKSHRSNQMPTSSELCWNVDTRGCFENTDTRQSYWGDVGVQNATACQ